MLHPRNSHFEFLQKSNPWKNQNLRFVLLVWGNGYSVPLFLGFRISILECCRFEPLDEWRDIVMKIPKHVAFLEHHHNATQKTPGNQARKGNPSFKFRGCQKMVLPIMEIGIRNVLSPKSSDDSDSWVCMLPVGPCQPKEWSGCFYFAVCSMVESIASTALCVCLGSRNYRLFDLASQTSTS